MKARKFPVEHFSKLHPAVSDYIGNTGPWRYPSTEDVLQSAEYQVRNFQHRATLVEVLLEQHAHLSPDSVVIQNIEALRSERTCTITTGHQLGVFGGPLFMASKILTVARWTSEMNRIQGEFQFVPVFWMASEDHDFDEIQTTHWRNQSWTWQHGKASCVGELHTENLEEGWAWLFEQCRESERELLLQLKQSSTVSDYSASFQRIVLHWFESFGVIVLNPHDVRLKRLFQNLMHQELAGEVSLKEVIASSDHKWNQSGYSEAVHVRDVNLFYLHDQTRSRIQRTDDGFELVGSSVKWSIEEALQLLQQHPERFSPNVVMRPIYQECILPNAAYVGGPGEVAYWLQILPAFQALEMKAPCVLLRHHLTLCDEAIVRKCQKINLSPDEAILDRDAIIQRWVHVDQSPMERAQADIQAVMQQLKQALIAFDVNLGSATDAEMHRMQTSLTQLEKKWMKSMRMKEEVAIQQLDAIRDQLQPQGIPHERQDALALWWARGGDELLRQIFLEMDPIRPEWIFLTVPTSHSIV